MYIVGRAHTHSGAVVCIAGLCLLLIVAVWGAVSTCLMCGGRVFDRLKVFLLSVPAATTSSLPLYFCSCDRLLLCASVKPTSHSLPAVALRAGVAAAIGCSVAPSDCLRQLPTRSPHRQTPPLSHTPLERSSVRLPHRQRPRPHFKFAPRPNFCCATYNFYHVEPFTSTAIVFRCPQRDGLTVVAPQIRKLVPAPPRLPTHFAQPNRR